MALKIVTFWWGDRYPAYYVQRLLAGLDRHLAQPFEFICAVEDDTIGRARRLNLRPSHAITHIKNPELLSVRGCFARLRLFDPEWQRQMTFDDGDRIVCLDLDVVLTGELDPLFDRPEPFLILQGANAANPCPYNGSCWSLLAGYRPDVWSDFSLDAASKIPFYEFSDDQGWLWHKLPNAAGWRVGRGSGIYAFMKPGWPKENNSLPKDARMVVFPGWRDPAKFEHLDWVRTNWRA